MKRLQSREKILVRAKTLFLTKGYNAASIDDICKKASISKGGFYHLFDSKEQLAIEVLDEFYLKHSALLADGEYDQIEDPYERVLSYLDHSKNVAEKIWGDGCLLMIFSTDTSKSGSRLRKKVRKLFDDFIEKTSSVFLVLFEGCEQDPQEQARKLAERYIAQLEGFIILSKAYKDTGRIKKGIEDFKENIKNLKTNP